MGQMHTTAPPAASVGSDKCASGGCTFAERLFFGRPAVPLKLEFAERWRAGTVDDSSGTFAAAPFGSRVASQKETTVPATATRRTCATTRWPHCEALRKFSACVRLPG